MRHFAVIRERADAKRVVSIEPFTILLGKKS
jgi:hypothetical protein